MPLGRCGREEEKKKEMASGPYWVEEGERKMGPIPYIQGATLLPVVPGPVLSFSWALVSPSEKVGGWTG